MFTMIRFSRLGALFVALIFLSLFTTKCLAESIAETVNRLDGELKGLRKEFDALKKGGSVSEMQSTALIRNIGIQINERLSPDLDMINDAFKLGCQPAANAVVTLDSNNTQKVQFVTRSDFMNGSSDSLAINVTAEFKCSREGVMRGLGFRVTPATNDAFPLECSGGEILKQINSASRKSSWDIEFGARINLYRSLDDVRTLVERGARVNCGIWFKQL